MPEMVVGPVNINSGYYGKPNLKFGKKLCFNNLCSERLLTNVLPALFSARDHNS